MMRDGLVALALLVAGCDRIPGTSANLEKVAREALADGLFDADSAKFQRLKAVTHTEAGKSERVICGEVNAKNKMGAYVGFTRFMVARDAGDWLVDPKDKTSEAELNDAMDACARMRRLGADATAFSCTRIDDLIERRAQQDGFNAVWKDYCGGK